MATGLEILGGVVASLELVRVSKGCLSSLNALRHADIQERDRSDIQFHLIVQGHKFDYWCSQLGIQSMFELSEITPHQWQQKLKVKEFEELLQNQLRFKNHDFSEVVLRTLKSMDQKFSDAEKLVTKYAASRAIQSSLNNRNKPSKYNLKVPNPLKKKEGSLLASNFSSDDISSTRSRFGRSFSRVQWVATDKRNAQDLLDSIVKVNASLVELLQPVQQAQIDRQTNLVILDNIDHHARYITQTLPQDSDVRALANMRLWQSRERRESEDKASSTYSGVILGLDAMSTKSITYSMQDFKKNTTRITDSRSFSILGDEPVVVEWKYFSKERPFSVEQLSRLSDLVRLLNINDLHKRFQALPCKGYVTDNENSRVGMIFSTGQTPTISSQSLHTVINTMKVTPPVGERFAMARRLVLAVHNLHAVRWLHKGIRGDNIICFQHSSKGDASASSENETKGLSIGLESNESPVPLEERHPLTQPPCPLPPFYLLGWDLSRPNHPEELSESISVSTLGLQTERETIRMYTHPDALSTKQLQGERPRYRAQWDIYSIGLILLEVGLWRTLDTMRRSIKSDDEFRLRLRTEYCDRLQARMGLIYWRAVQRCLNNDFDVSEEGISGNHDYSLQVEFEKQVVFELEKCFA